MAKTLDTDSRDLLNYKPNINYEEPEVGEGEITPLEVDETKLNEVKELRDKAKKLATAVNLLATATQAKVDEFSKDVIIKLDPIVDGAVVQSVKRMFGDGKINPYQITYAQYKECKNRLLQKGVDIGKRAIITPEQMQKAKNELYGTGENNRNVHPLTKLGKFGTEEGATGGLRPELNDDAKILEPLDLEQFQAYIVRSFMNAVWKKFIKPVMPDFVADLLPEEICEIPPDGISTEELMSLGIPIFGIPKPPEPIEIDVDAPTDFNEDSEKEEGSQ